MGDEMKIRWAAAGDVDAIVRVINLAFRAAESFFIERDRITAETLRKMMEKGKFLLAEEAGGLVGACISSCAVSVHISGCWRWTRRGNEAASGGG